MANTSPTLFFGGLKSMRWRLIAILAHRNFYCGSDMCVRMRMRRGVMATPNKWLRFRQTIGRRSAVSNALTVGTGRSLLGFHNAPITVSLINWDVVSFSRDAPHQKNVRRAKPKRDREMGRRSCRRRRILSFLSFWHLVNTRPIDEDGNHIDGDDDDDDGSAFIQQTDWHLNFERHSIVVAYLEHYINTK